MLCTKIVITDDNGKKSQKIIDYIKHSGKIYSLDDGCSATVITADLDDDKLYDLCGKLTDFIADGIIRHEIYRLTDKSYTCFNFEEKEKIADAVIAKSEIKEITGRLYVYLKFSKAVNPYGFYRFLCRDIHSSLEFFVSNEAERLIGMNDTDDLTEILKYFARMSPQCVKRVDLSATQNGLSIVSVDSDSNDFKAEFASTDMYGEDIVSELVNLNPQKIVIHGRSYYQKNELAPIIGAVFGNRVELCSGCDKCPDNDK